MRALLIVNPRATTTSTRTADVIVQALSHELDLEVTFTTHRGHGRDLGHWALDNRLDAVIALGGDGVVNEVLNGILRDGPGPGVPALGVIPGGSANVFSRALQVPTDPVEATGVVLRSVREGRYRLIGLGHIATHDDERWFTVNAGLGLDAQIIEAMESKRRRGLRATPVRYLTTTVREYFARSGSPTMSLQRPGVPDTRGAVLTIVQNTSPWTYFGSVPIDPCPHASFATGLDVFALRRLGPVTTARAARRMLARSAAAADTGSGIILWHDQSSFTVVVDAPVDNESPGVPLQVALQVDGESLGYTDRAHFTAHAEALRVMGTP